MNFHSVKEQVLNKLNTDLPKNLTYHDIDHTRDVLESATRIAINEKITGESLVLLRTAALLHDIGFVKVYKQHEEISCEISRVILPGEGYSTEQIDHICEMIMATKIPQSPKDLLGRILCDADLDYLGREDFWTIGETLYMEFLEYGIVNNEQEWNRLQLNFLSNHNYFTETSNHTRKPKKEKHLDMIRHIVSGYYEDMS